MRFFLPLALGAALSAGGLLVQAVGAEAKPIPDDAPYKDHVKCEQTADGKRDCRVDLYAMRGFRAFSQCQVCHGIDGHGSSFAPSLLAKMKELDKGTFINVVVNGYRGQMGVMPAWKDNPNVMNHLDNLYVYLMARADNMLPAGRVERFDRE
ncbi:MAG: c-type cytochrome [Thiotrichales bacterium]